MKRLLTIQVVGVAILCALHVQYDSMPVYLAVLITVGCLAVAAASIGLSPMAERMARRRWAKATKIKRQLRRHIEMIERIELAEWPEPDDYAPHDATQ